MAIFISKMAWAPLEHGRTSKSSVLASAQALWVGHRALLVWEQSVVCGMCFLSLHHICYNQFNGLSFMYQDKSEVTAGLCGREKLMCKTW